ncbi:hypothetical protein FA09DRAFT_346927, partial [Tilletiopsis washingtonensis]
MPPKTRSRAKNERTVTVSQAAHKGGAKAQVASRTKTTHGAAKPQVAEQVKSLDVPAMLQKVEQENDALRVTLEKTELDLALAQSRLQMFRQVSDALGCATNRGAASKSELKAALLRYNGGVDDFVNSLNLDGEVTYFVQAMRCILLPDAFEGTQQYIAQLSSMSGASDRGRVKLTNFLRDCIHRFVHHRFATTFCWEAAQDNRHALMTFEHLGASSETLPVARLVRAWYHRGQREVLSGNSQHALKLLTKQLAKRIVSHTKHLLEGQIEFSDDEKERLQRRVLIPFTELHKTIREDA